MLPLWGESRGGPHLNKEVWPGRNKVSFMKHGSLLGQICPLRLSLSDLWWKTRPWEKYPDLRRCLCSQRCTPLAVLLETLPGSPVFAHELQCWSLWSSIVLGPGTSQCGHWCFCVHRHCSRLHGGCVLSYRVQRQDRRQSGKVDSCLGPHLVWMLCGDPQLNAGLVS